MSLFTYLCRYYLPVNIYVFICIYIYMFIRTPVWQAIEGGGQADCGECEALKAQLLEREREVSVQGYLAHKKHLPPRTTVGL